MQLILLKSILKECTKTEKWASVMSNKLRKTKYALAKANRGMGISGACKVYKRQKQV